MSQILMTIVLVALFKQTYSVTVTDCGSNSLQINYYKVSSDVIKPGTTINITADFEILEQIGSPLSLEVTLKRKTWLVDVKIPCIGDIGSCTYDNGCEALAGVLLGKECPKEVLDLGLKCECPLDPMHLSIRNQVIKLPIIPGAIARFLASGKYYAKAVLKNPYTGYVHVCVEVNLELDS